MAVFKCKMCGGTLEVNNESVATCEYCGTQQTLPKLDDERKANLYDRANHFRRNNEFDKAMGIYEQILNEDNTDAESYWSLVLCRYGIEYVEDPSSHKRIPTVNRAQFTSIFDDDNYKSALQYADIAQKAIYEAEANAINEIQKGILAISQKEEPFDVFICYKETDNNGRRTPDSVLANDLYHQLKQEGFKVFFARITLEDVLGTAYEPYIFAALNSAKVMVVLGTKPEYFNAVWVKNEWSRYLALIKNGAKKMLIPAYKDMDPYDLPEEFSHLQAQDMSKLGFMQDLIRGIKKIAQDDTPKATVVKETVVSSGNVNANTAPLLKRAFMFLEDGEFDRADDFCEQVLNIDPECAEAYLGKLMAELHVKQQDNLKNKIEPFNNNNNYQKAVRFADDELKSTLVGYIEYIKTRNENTRLESIYNRAKDDMNSATAEYSYRETADRFDSIKGYKDSEALAKECREKAEIARKDAILKEAKSLNAGIYQYGKAIELLETIPGWRDADETILACRKAIDDLEAKSQKTEKLMKKIALIVTSSLVTIIVIIILLTKIIIPTIKYNAAIDLMESGKYEEAISAFKALDGYKDSVTKQQECKTLKLSIKYNEAVALMNEGKYEEAESVFAKIGGYKDSNAKRQECEYNIAVALMDAGNYEEAISAFEKLAGYKDSAEQINNCYDSLYAPNYNEALRLINEKKFNEALALLKTVRGYKDASDIEGRLRFNGTWESENGKIITINYDEKVVIYGPSKYKFHIDNKPSGLYFTNSKDDHYLSSDDYYMITYVSDAEYDRFYVINLDETYLKRIG